MAISINGTAFDGSGAAVGIPTSITQRKQKIGATLVSANGTRNRVNRNVNKYAWDIAWETNNATMLAVRAIFDLNGTFTFIDVAGTSYTVQVEDDEFEAEYAFASNTGAHYWNVSLTLWQV